MQSSDHSQPNGHRWRSELPSWLHDELTPSQLASLGYVKMWQKLLAASRLPQPQKAVGWALSLYCYGRSAGDVSLREVQRVSATADPSLHGLAADCTTSVGAVSRALKALDDHGWIDRDRTRGGRGQRTAYTLTLSLGNSFLGKQFQANAKTVSEQPRNSLHGSHEGVEAKQGDAAARRRARTELEDSGVLPRRRGVA